MPGDKMYLLLKQYIVITAASRAAYLITDNNFKNNSGSNLFSSKIVDYS